MVKRNSIIIFVLCLSLLVFAIPATAQTTLEVWHYFAEGTNAVRWSIEKFNEEHEDIQLEHRYVPFDDLKRELTRAVTVETEPDIVFIDNPDHVQYASMGVLADITEYVEEWGKADLYFDGPWNSVTYQDRVYGIPQNSNTILLFYNKDMIEEAGLEGPPETWSELRHYAEVLTNPDENVRGFSICARRAEDGVFQFLPFVQMGGADITSMGSQGAIDALTLWSDLYQEGWMVPESLNQDQSEAMTHFAGENAAMAMTGPWDLGLVEDVDFNWDVTLLPYKEDVGIRSSALGGENFAIMANSDHIEEAWEYIKWTQRRDFVEEMYIEGDRMPSRSDVAEESDYWAQDPVLGAFLEQLEYAQARGPHPRWPELSDVVQIAMHEAMTGQKTPEEALNDAAAEIQEILSE